MSETNRILLVDDEEANRDMLSRRLRRSGFEVEVAGDGESALAQVRDGDIDLVLLDSMMPGMSGVDVPDQLPVIMVTALTDSSKVVEALNLGANDYVTKPVDFPVALARIRSQMARKAAESALRQSEERYALAARGSNDGLWDWDLRSNRIYYSDRWKAILGFAPAEIADGENEWFSRVHAEDAGPLRRDLESHWNGASGDTMESEFRMLHKLGAYRWVRSRGARMPPAGRCAWPDRWPILPRPKCTTGSPVWRTGSCFRSAWSRRCATTGEIRTRGLEFFFWILIASR
jgi:PAS domain S-box-containing protein